VVPLYIALLYRAMKAQNIHEDCIRQMQRLFADRLYSGSAVAVDDEGRIRMDDREMRADIQKEVDDIWQNIEKADLSSVADFEGYRKAFLQCHGFDVDGVDYEVDVTV
jgi:enoyl-[acyl-carrier protein] reductase/trans-2-enoyl-CoA reductase (NAD+)